jgi:hypothetical protein
MNIDFDNIFEHVISMDNFNLNWRFTDEKYDKLPEQDIKLLKPLNKAASTFLSEYISKINLHEDIPFKKNFFNTIENVTILDGNEKDIKKWLCERGLPFDKPVFISWDKENAMIVPWKLLIKYFDSFYYPSSDDLTIIDRSLDWALLFSHWDEIYFGTKKAFKPTDLYANIGFIW